MSIEGVIVKRDADSITVRDLRGFDYIVKLTSGTSVKERKGNPFRRGKDYATTSLLRGLNIEVQGRGDDSGALIADQIRIRNEAAYCR